jgi:hypothetical protein
MRCEVARERHSRPAPEGPTALFTSNALSIDGAPSTDECASRARSQVSVHFDTRRLQSDGPATQGRAARTFSADGNTIEGRWETSPDGRDWELDFELTYHRVRAGRDAPGLRG